MAAPESIKQLVAKFTENREAYRSGKYNEAQLRQQFLDPFFKALGWDIYNEAGVSPEYQDVKIEDSLLIEGGSKAPDYTFRIGKERKFFVEAKKPAVDIQYDIHPAYQLKRYAWNAHLPLSILTDFEEFAVYNCKQTPNPSDSAATGRDLFYKYTDYVAKWDEIAAIFSKDAVWKGSFDRYAETSKGKKGTTEVDDAILESIESWRKLLAQNIVLRNPQVADEGQLNFAVQMTIDRILFLRICEDRGIEPEEQFKSMLAQPGIYAQMMALFKRADMKYNSGLFHFTTEKGTSAADAFTPGLTIDDRVLKEIIKDIYYPCPYIFKEIPVEILGQVYEQFLGKVIHLTAGHQARVEEKPEVRKAGGVYYTPKYIVDYIVENTVGKLLEDRTPESAAELKIVDPACGSGSFLLGAYQHLLDWHLKWYTANDPEKWAKGKKPALMAANKGGWKLTTDKKKEILVNNIHGVDIDAQAVEVTKLSLLLKVLEEESGQLSLGLERVLPDLGKNIQCGNSLIGEDYFEGQLVVDEKERQRVNPFNWHSAFSSVFAKGGFDAVIGNPPYLGMENMESSHRDYYYGKTKNGNKRFSTALHKSNLYSIFWEQAIKLSKNKGLVGLITPYSWLSNSSFIELRRLFVEKTTILIINLLPLGIFTDAGIKTCTTIIQNQESIDTHKINVQNLREISVNEIERTIGTDTNHINLSIGSIKNTPEFIFNIEENEIGLEIIQKIGKRSVLLADLSLSNRGCDTANNEKYSGFENVQKLNPKHLLEGKNFWRYGYKWQGLFLYYLPEKMKKENSKARPGEKERFEVPEKLIIYRFLDKQNKFISTYDKEQHYCLGSCYVLTNFANTSENLKYILAILNSKLVAFYNKSLFKGVKVTLSELNRIPIHSIDFSKSAEVKQHDRMVALVERMLELHKRTPSTPQEQERLTRDIASTDREIDKLVYELYGLSEEEIKIVEGG